MPIEIDDETFYMVKEIAAEMDRSERGIRLYIECGRLEAIKISSVWIIHEAEFARFKRLLPTLPRGQRGRRKRIRIEQTDAEKKQIASYYRKAGKTVPERFLAPSIPLTLTPVPDPVQLDSEEK